MDQLSAPEDVIEALAATSYDLILLGCSSPFDWAAWLRQFGKPAATGFVVLVAEEEEQRIAGFEAGADDCLSPCVGVRELAARVQSILRRPRGFPRQVLRAGNLQMDCMNKEVAVEGEPVLIPLRELRIMELIMRRPGRTVTRQALEEDLYGSCMGTNPNAIEARVSCLRRRLATAGANVTVRNVRGIGYKMVQVQSGIPEDWHAQRQ